MSKVDIYLDKEQIKSLKSLLDQSELGVHLLFDNESISEVFQKSFSEDDFFQVENLKKVQNHFLKLLQFKNIIDKKEFVKCLSDEDQERLIRAYFYIIENNIKSAKNSLKH